MKNIALLVFGIIALAIAAFAILIATLPRAKVTITAIGPTGKVVTYTNATGEVVNGQEWLFGITNVGQVTAYWVATLRAQRSDVPTPSFRRRTVIGSMEC
jgi:hypothetical protein